MKSRSTSTTLLARLFRGKSTVGALLAAAFCVMSAPAQGQATKGAPLPNMPRPPAPESHALFDATELDRVLSPIALYPDPLLAQTLTAATFGNQITQAAEWSATHRGLVGQALTDALANERVSWDPSVQAMLAFPTVLQMMASDMPWTQEIGEAFQAQREDVMDAVQRLRSQAQKYGYLHSNDELQVSTAGPIEIIPANPEYIVVPYYDPIVVFAPPPPRYILSSAIYFGYGVRLGLWFQPWGYGPGGFHWASHRVVYGYPGWGRPWNYGGRYARGYSPVPMYSRNYDGRGGRNDGYSRSREYVSRGETGRTARRNGERERYDGVDRSGSRRAAPSGGAPSIGRSGGRQDGGVARSTSRGGGGGRSSSHGGGGSGRGGKTR